jgi:hydroxymethylglutaryl-CoA lyase
MAWEVFYNTSLNISFSFCIQQISCSMISQRNIKLVECPRDAMQGWDHLIPTAQKIAYINALLRCGFDTIDFGSFVSPKAIPQMADTAEVLRGLQLDSTTTKLLAIVANLRGATEALVFNQVSYLGFPFSISPVFQLRNANSTLEKSLEMVEEMQNLCVKNQKQLVVYISMGFGNPYGDAYNEEIVLEWVDKIVGLDVGILSIADTVGLASPDLVAAVLNKLIPAYPATEIGVHLHSAPGNWQAKIDAALTAGCYRFDGALKGIGGCPMAGDDLVGNMDMEKMIPYFEQRGLPTGIHLDQLAIASSMAAQIFTPVLS